MLAAVRAGLLVLLAADCWGFAGHEQWLERMQAGNRLRLAGRLEAAEKEYREALATAEGFGEADVRLAATLNNLAGVYQDRHEYARAEPLLERALAIREKRPGAGLGVAAILNNLGAGYAAAGRVADAESAYRRAAALGGKPAGEDPVQVAYALAGLGGLYLESGRIKEAEPVLRRGLSVVEERVAPDHPVRVRLLFFLGNLEYARGRYGPAESAWNRGLVLAGASAKSAEIAASLRMNLGELRRFERRYGEAEALLGQAISAFEEAGGHPNLAAALHQLALVRFEQGRWSEAGPLFGRALAIVEAGPAPGSLRHAAILHNFARLRQHQSAPAEAEVLFRRALENVEGLAGGHPSLKPLLVDYAGLLQGLGRKQEAEALLRRARRIGPPERYRHSIDLRELRRMESGKR